MTSFGSQLRQVMRRLRRAPMFTAITLATLAVAIGANTAIFSVVEGVLLKPLPYPHAEQLIDVSHSAPGVGINDAGMSPSMNFVYREQNRTLQDIGMYNDDTVTVTGVAQPEQVRALAVTDGVLPVLGVTPKLGRWFNRTDDSPSGAATVMLSNGYWRTKFGSDPAAVGKSLTIDGKPHEIIGVMPEDFRFMDEETPPLILPLALDRNKTYLGQFSFSGVARLKPGVTLEQASADVARMVPIVWNSFPAPPGFSLELFKKANVSPYLRPLKARVVGDVGALLWVLMGGIGMVLLIACANIANLLLVRTEGRQQELAIRAALGAGWSRIAGELLFESVVLGIIGSVFGLGLAYGALRALVSIAPAGLPRLYEIGIDANVLLFTLGIVLVASLLFGCVPVFKYAGTRLGTGLREIGRSLTQSRERHRVRSVLVVVQVALAFVLMISSGLMIRTFRALTRVNPGFTNPGTVQTLRIYIPDSEAKDAEAVIRMQQQIANRIAAIPGVTSAGFSNGVPLDGDGWTDPIYAADKSYANGQIPPLRRFKFVSPDFLDTLGTPLIAGRDFTWTDTLNKTPVAMVSENAAKEFWGSPTAALGKQIRVSTTDEWRQVIGVVADVHADGMDQPAPASAYWPMIVNHFESDLAPQARRSAAFAIRSSRAGSSNLMQEVQKAVWSVDANLPLARVHTLDYYYTQSMARTSFTLVMLALAGGMALLLGVVGLYGVIAYSVSQRTREIGIRMALGAQQPSLIGMFVRHGMWLAGAGVICGAGAAIAVMRLLSSLLFGVSPTDPVTYMAVLICLIATATLASYLPSRRAANVDPVEALRAE
ncbi:MAG TPA: ABC transporter permease [Candidatus Acidoferrales bacterium]|nr:ABC transporter permease [Candidatus Acidoferrales bacterium]